MHHPQNFTDDDTSILPSSMRRLVKLPLRKHHSFHFQPSQTVAGSLKQTKNRYKNNGPLVFKPLNEKSAFKPITPVPKSSTQGGEIGTTLSSDTAMMNGDHQSKGNMSNGNDHMHSITSSTAAPRICGTSLKRHISNVETYNRSRSIDETNSMSDDEDSASVTPASSSSASIVRGKRLHYADLAPLCASIRSASNTNLNSINSSSRNNNVNNNNHIKNTNNNNINNNNENNNGSASNSSSCTISSSDNKTATDANPNELNRSSASANAQHSQSNGSLPIKRTTQYATLKFNEVNI